MAGLPDLLTIEEAAEVIRVGRTKAYAMARQWRATDGKAGLPVIDFGHALRVPRCQLEKLVGGTLNARDYTEVEPAGEPGPAAVSLASQTPADEAPAAGLKDEAGASVDTAAVPDRSDTRSPDPRRPPRRRSVAPDQLTLPFET